MTRKQQAALRQANWRAALAEERVLRFDGGAYLTSYPTIAARDTALIEAQCAGMPCEVVHAPNS